MAGKIFSINISQQKGVPKRTVKTAFVKQGHGLEGDAHAGVGFSQVSLLSIESIKKSVAELGPGDFAENITTEGISLMDLKIGDSLRLGKDAILEISKIGKDCHKPCAIYYRSGNCIMPREGIFATVVKGGEIFTGDEIAHV